MVSSDALSAVHGTSLDRKTAVNQTRKAPARLVVSERRCARAA